VYIGWRIYLYGPDEINTAPAAGSGVTVRLLLNNNIAHIAGAAVINDNVIKRTSL